jgi:integrase
MTGQPMFDEYLNDFLRREHEKTAECYSRLLTPFEGWLAERNLATTFDRENVIEFCEAQRWSNSTRNLFLSALRGWARDADSKLPVGTTPEEIQHWREAEKRLKRVINLKSYKVQRKEKVPLSIEQIDDLLRHMAGYAQSNKNADTVLWILLWFGIRVGELQMIQNIDFEKGELVVETEKVGGTRKLYFDKYTAWRLKVAQEQKVFELPASTIRKQFAKYSHVIAPARLNPHAARHTFATQFAPLCDSFTLKRMLGHGYTGATDAYAHAQDEVVMSLMLEKHFMLQLEPENFGKQEVEKVGA